MLPDSTAGERARVALVVGLMGLWFFWLGASLGSFLNVAVYRLPLGKSLWRSRSRCPRCDRAIRARHNLPVIGWLWLRGRCHDCGQPISARYPLVECLLGLMFLALFLAELCTAGGNLPWPVVPLHRLYWVGWLGQWNLIGLYFYHALLLMALLGAALLRFDQNPIPWGYVAWCLVPGLGLALLWPTLHVVPWYVESTAPPPPADWQSSLASGVLGLIVGCVLGWGWEVVDRWRSPAEVAHRSAAIGLALVGLVLGWQAVLAVALIAGGARLIGRAASLLWPALDRLPLLGWVTAGTLVHVIVWRISSGWKFWPGPACSRHVVLWSVVACFIGWLVTALLPSPPRPRPEESPLATP